MYVLYVIVKMCGLYKKWSELYIKAVKSMHGSCINTSAYS